MMMWPYGYPRAPEPIFIKKKSVTLNKSPMKKMLLLAGLSMLMHTALAQIYIRANIGYNLPLSPELIGTERTYQEIPDQGYVEEFTGVYGSYGSGFSAGVAFGGSFKNSMLGYDIAFNYLLGKKYAVTSTTDYGDYSYSQEISHYSRSFQFMPSITLAVGAGKFQPFTRFGPVFSLTTVNEERTEYNTYEDVEYYTNFEYTGGVAIGLHGSVGLTYGISDQLKLFTEINMISMSYAAHKRTITDYTVDGEDRLDTLNEEYREMDLEKSYKTESEEADPVMREPVSMNSWGLQFGVVYSFGQ